MVALLLIAILIAPVNAFAGCMDDDLVAKSRREIDRAKQQLVDMHPVYREPFQIYIKELMANIDALERAIQACKQAEPTATSPVQAQRGPTYICADADIDITSCIPLPTRQQERRQLLDRLKEEPADPDTNEPKALYPIFCQAYRDGRWVGISCWDD